jgi:Zn-dependent protease with chaperone function
MSAGALLQFALVGGFVVAIGLAALMAVGSRPILAALCAQPPTARARTAWWLLVGPLAIGLAYAAAIVAIPSLMAGTHGLAAACSSHDRNWWHGCVWHPLEQGASPWLWAGLGALAIASAALVTRAGRALLQARNHARALVRLARPVADVRVLDTEAPLAVACGVGCGHVLLSSGLVEALPADQLRVVLAHERAHLAHADVRWRLAARILSALHFPGTRSRLLQALVLASEQRCDRVAAEEVGSRVLVAETLLAVERLYAQRLPTRAPALAAAFGTDFLHERVEALLTEIPDGRLPVGMALVAAVALLLAASPGSVHRVTEFLTTLPVG